MAAGSVRAREGRLNNDHLACGGAANHSLVQRGPPASQPRLTARQLAMAKHFMLGRLGDRLSVGEVAEALTLSTSYFVRSFTNTVGVAPYRWLVEQRISQARELLTRTTIPLAQVALECGFTDQSHFTNAFNRRVGTTPSKWRKREGAQHLHVAWGRLDPGQPRQLEAVGFNQKQG